MNARRRLVAALVLAGALSALSAAGVAAAPEARPVPVLPESLTWSGPPDNPLLKSSWVVGAEKQPGPYLLRVKLGAGARIAPHSHPDQRVSTVLTGTIYVGFGSVFDETKVVAIPAGGVYVAPANVPHYVWAKDGDAQYQESGIGPTGNLLPK